MADTCSKCLGSHPGWSCSEWDAANSEPYAWAERGRAWAKQARTEDQLRADLATLTAERDTAKGWATVYLQERDEARARADRAEADCQSLRELAADQMRVLGGGLQRAEAEVARLRGALEKIQNGARSNPVDAVVALAHDALCGEVPV